MGETSLYWQDIAALKDPSKLPFLRYYLEAYDHARTLDREQRDEMDNILAWARCYLTTRR